MRADTFRNMANIPERIPWAQTPKGIAKRELRELTRNPPLRADDAIQVLKALASGLRITKVGEIAGLPPYWLINLWRSEHPEFDELCVQASEAGADALAWECLEIADNDDRLPANKALSIQVRERMAKVLNRKKYDPAVKVEVSGSVARADDLTDADLAAVVRRAATGSAEDAVITGGENGS